MTTPKPDPMTAEREPTVSELAPAAIKRLQNWIATYCEKMPRAIHDDVLIVTTMALGAIKSEAEITRLKAENESLATDVRLLRVGNTELLERIASLKQLLADCPVDLIHHPIMAASWNAWLDARAKALGEEC